MSFQSDAHRRAMYAKRYGKLTKNEKEMNDLHISMYEFPKNKDELERELRFYQGNQKYQDNIYHNKLPHYKNAERITHEHDQRMIDLIKGKLKNTGVKK